MCVVNSVTVILARSSCLDFFCSSLGFDVPPVAAQFLSADINHTAMLSPLFCSQISGLAVLFRFVLLVCTHQNFLFVIEKIYLCEKQYVNNFVFLKTQHEKQTWGLEGLEQNRT